MNLQALANEKSILVAKVSDLEGRGPIVEEHVAQGEFSKEATIQEAVERVAGEVVDHFKQSEEHAALMTMKCHASYNQGVMKIFFTILRKSQKVYHKFLGPEFTNLMNGWVAEEQQGILNTEPPTLLEYPDVEGNKLICEFDPPTKLLEEAPIANAEKEVVASNAIVVELVLAIN